MSTQSNVDGDRLCGIARRLDERVMCPPGGCALLIALGYVRSTADSAICPLDAIAGSRDDLLVTETLDALRREIERLGLPLSAARAARSRPARHAAVLQRWALDGRRPEDDSATVRPSGATPSTSSHPPVAPAPRSALGWAPRTTKRAGGH